MLAYAGHGFAMTAQELQQALANGEAITVIDVRSQARFAAGHIPGAINLPAELIARKQLPPLGRVVVYGDGIETHVAQQAVTLLQAKPGLSVDLLQGGMAAWQEVNLPNTQDVGMSAERTREVSFGELQKIAASDAAVVLIDMRTQDPALSDLHQHFPQARIIKAHPRNAGVARAVLSDKAGRATNLYVLIGDGDELAENTAARLQAAGVRRLAVLAGGERILRRDGYTGIRTTTSGE